jgi:pimeloyl-ACP methyl ester carboxylesterase
MNSASKGAAMQAPMNRTFTPARVVALALIAVVAGGLAYLRFAPDGAAVSVPRGAQAGQLTLHPCHYATEDGTYDADCGTLVVPENRADPQSRLIALPVTRIRARSAHAAEPILRLEGGPGLTNMEFGNASRFTDHHDVVLVGYRGVDGSSVLDCPEVESALKHSTDFLGEKSFSAYADGFRSCADRLRDGGVALAGYSLPERVDDLEAARRALGYHRVDLLSESAGTRTAMIYSWRYPRSIHRSVMIGVNPPGNFLWYPKTIDEQIRKYSALCAQDDSCARRTDDLAGTLRTTSADIPDHWWFLPIKKGNVRIALFYGLMESTQEAAPLSAPITLSSLLAAEDGDPSGLWFMSVLADLAFPRSFVWGDVAAVGRADARAAERYFTSGEHGRDSIIGSPGTDFVWAGGRLRTAWPAGPDDARYGHVRTSRVPTLLIGGDLDFATPPQNATRELMPYLPNGRQVVLPNLGHTTDFWSYQPAAGSRLINTFLDSGRVDDSLYKRARVDFTPGVRETTLAKGIAGTMVGLGLLTVLSLLWMPLRVHRRGRFGRTAGAVLRSVYPIVLGLGGWFLGVLIVITTMPGVPLDDELLAALSVGAPVGLGIYWAWVHREWSPQSKAVGLAAAAGGSLAGAWLGFHAASDLLALVTAIAGAVVGANLALILLDMSRARSAGVQPATETAVDLRRPDLEPAAPTGAGRP